MEKINKANIVLDFDTKRIIISSSAEILFFVLLVVFGQHGVMQTRIDQETKVPQCMGT